MKCLHGAVPLSLLILAVALPGLGKEPSASASGTIIDTPVSSAPAASASTVASASATAASPTASENQASAVASAMQATSAAQASSATSASIAAQRLNWKTGPRDIALLDQATVNIPQDFAYLEQEDARQLLRKLGNPNADDVTGLFVGPGGNWLLVVRFDKSGYVKDSEAPDWKLDELFGALKSNVEQTNAMRKKNGASETEIVGWIEKPNYDATRHRLIWAVSSRDKGAKQSDFQSVNFNMYLLGREGYFNFNLVTDLALLEQNKKYASMLVSSVVFKDGKKYGDFKNSTDKVAAYTVAGLVAGSEYAGAADKKGHAPARSDSKFVKFIKVFSVILFSLLALVGVGLGIYSVVRKKRATNLEVEVAQDEAEASPAR